MGTALLGLAKAKKRIERLKERTGLDGQRYHDLTELLLASECWRR